MPCVSVYWQLLANAMADEMEKMQFEFLTHVCYTFGTFGCSEERSWAMHHWNEQNGNMTDNQINIYINNSI
jgi:hypothetical protein